MKKIEINGLNCSSEYFYPIICECLEFVSSNVIFDFANESLFLENK